MKEIGLEQMNPTIIYQDNQAAIQAAIHIANNRGTLVKKTRAMDMRTLAVRNLVEDMKVVPVYLETVKRLADIGAKALEPNRFKILRDWMTGYGVLEAKTNEKWNEYSVLMVRLALERKWSY
jgi:hypothetical protein